MGDFTDNRLLGELSYALFYNDGIVSWYVDLTEGTIVSIVDDYLNEEKCSEQFPIPQWEKDYIKDAKKTLKHELMEILPKPSYISFGIMESFAATCTEKQQKSLFDALSKKHPFSRFRQTVERIGILQEWYDFKNKEELYFAKKWLKVENLAIQDGKIIRVSVDLSE